MLFFALLINQPSMDITEFSYTGYEETYPVHGTYKFELWGAQGGGGYDDDDQDSSGGNGAYVYGEATFSSEEILAIKVGQQGSSSEKGPNLGGYPDGGKGGKDTGSDGDKRRWADGPEDILRDME